MVEKYGRDALGLYELQRTVWEDFNFSTTTVEETMQDLKVIWNIYAFASIYMNLDQFEPEKWPVWEGNLRPEDKWLVSKTESLKLLVQKETEESQHT